MEEGKTVQYTDTQLLFLDLIKKYPVKNPETIVDYVTSQGEVVLEEPDQLAKALSECEITPVRRRQILKHWFASQGVEVPELILKQATISAENKASVAEQEIRRGEKYSVDTESGAIKVASTTDKTALTWDEAEKLSAKIKKDIEVKEKKEGQVDKSDKEPQIIFDGEGNPKLNPKAKLSVQDLMMLRSMEAAEARGEKADPLEIMTKQAETIERARAVFSGGREGGGLAELANTMKTLKELTGADEDTKALLSGIYKKLTEGGEGKGESEEVKGLREDVRKLMDELDKKEREKITAQLQNLQTQYTELRGELAKAMGEARAKDEYGIMSEALKMLDHRAGAMETTIQGIFGRRPPPLGAGEKKELTEAISEETKGEAELDRLADKAFYEHP